ncbi:conserved Plasmodium protein, unknown function [Plasmodium knowlesi strain H]|uniref:Uncharacterized protein n=3 Tax=Plasmodium knowlesi TaxID=5850 RepID=A0A5K1UZ17_PLAKH|nr:conserved Plasmodium protein, unknown function [Plasmodium knowlesi strain H]OTN64559.1 Uncharacterized protein PKNOH_S130213500 [Plasmodium knowlesi]CAA9989295.1 conserved Plasmodium protein, unknown function [Plasmodium knowlesi strain H]SBO26129.1 conserved Plasmodium protein, unknown function [Plasmodium knowlesi strain H]SBO26802.1 conserved Plasmodium protein, unknown function [Plasmodium knowlesi strain H]VVS78769.1 conserved Plasmodium protein, unknown function [Plasmodium knowlesi |eukprot:XP_002261642.1 hypothetical protein, conserved in Plasmodium species [Plasmodium knowlesi strain H]
MTTEEVSQLGAEQGEDGNGDSQELEKNEQTMESISKVEENNEHVQKRFEALNNTIENMNIHFNTILKDNEEKYILAFNTYMYDVQKEIRVLKKIVKEEKIRELKDERVKKLQKELKWYINECLRLDNVSQFLKKEAEKWKRNSELMKNHMLFLEKKLAKMYDKVILKEEPGVGAETGTQAKEGPFYRKEGNAQKRNIAPKKAQKREQYVGGAQCGGQSEGGKAERISKHKSKMEENNSKELQHRVANLEKKLKKQININCSLQEKLTKHYIEKSQYEKLFMECALQVKKDLAKLAMSNDKEKYVEENFTSLMNEAELSYFTKEEKKKLLVSFFSSNDLIQFVKKNVFCKDRTSFDLQPKNSYPSRAIKYQKLSDISPFIL